MTTASRPGPRVLGSLSVERGIGVIRMELRLLSNVEEVWESLTDPLRLAAWYGEVTGDLRPGGTYRARVHASGWDGTGRVEACERPRLLRTVSQDPDEPDEHTMEVLLSPDGDGTLLVAHQRGVPVALLWAYAAGLQIHVEDLEDHLVGKDRRAPEPRWDELEAVYTSMQPTSDGE